MYLYFLQYILIYIIFNLIRERENKYLKSNYIYNHNFKKKITHVFLNSETPEKDTDIGGKTKETRRHV